jgi:uncharacterized protein
MILILFVVLLALVAFLYASVGHGGASGYMAVILLLGFAPAQFKVPVLYMNILVSGISFIGFYRAGQFKFERFWPFAITSVPAALFGGSFSVGDTLYKKLLAICLLVSIARLLWQNKLENAYEKPFSTVWAMLIGAFIGVISGMLGIGGGILLSPLLLLFNWSTLKQTAAISALFILVNSLAALLGQALFGKVGSYNFMSGQYGNAILLAVFVGGSIGSYYGSKKFNTKELQYLLAIGLSIASAKLFFS